MGRNAKVPELEWTGKFWRLRFTYEGVRHDFKNMTIPKGDKARANRWKGERVEYVFSGKWKEEKEEGTDPSAALKNVFAAYISEKGGGEITKKTADKYQECFKKRFLKRWPKLSDVTRGALAAYQAERLKEVQYTTIKKEFAPLRQTLKFAEERGFIAQVPRFPAPPVKSKGTKHKNAPSGFTPGFTAEMAQQLIACLPAFTKADKDGVRWPLRGHFEFAYETGLRPGLLVGMRYGVHWQKGQPFLHVTADIDKGRWERDLPLTKRALEVLESIEPKADGALFGDKDFRAGLRAAARKAELPEFIAGKIKPYDMRHARTTEWVNGTNQPLGVGYLVGHKLVTTTNRYSHADRRQGEEVIAASNKKPEGSNE